MGGVLVWLRKFGELLRGLFVHNFLLKLLSIGIACGLWFFVNAAQRDSETEFSIPVRHQNPPADLILISPRVDEVDLRLSGPSTLLSRIDPAALEVTINLSRVRAGTTTFRLRSDRLNLPRGVTPIRMTPSELTLEFARMEAKRVPVNLALDGRPAGDLRIAESKVSPEQVEIRGPARIVREIAVAKTRPLDLRDAKPGRVTREIDLDITGEFLTVSAPTVYVELLLEEPIESRKIGAVTIVVRNAIGEATVAPREVTLEVKGARSKVQGLELPNGAVYVDATGLPAGKHELKPSASLPAGIELVKELAAVKVEIEDKVELTPVAPMTPAQQQNESNVIFGPRGNNAG